jgi:hypothetical protein
MGTLDDPLFALIALIDSIGFALTPAMPRQVNPKDEWFWTREWQRSERDASDDLKSGRYEDFATIEQVIEVLLQNIVTDDPQRLDRVAAALRMSRRRLQ